MKDDSRMLYHLLLTEPKIYANIFMFKMQTYTSKSKINS